MRFLIFALAILMCSCFEQGDCSDLSSHVMQVNFYDNVSKKGLALDIDSIKMPGLDTVLYRAKRLSVVLLPLDPATTNMTYVFYFENTQATLEITYTNKTYALAPDCNAIDLVTLTEVSSVSIASSQIAQPKLTNELVENIKLYF